MRPRGLPADDGQTDTASERTFGASMRPRGLPADDPYDSREEAIEAGLQ